MLLGREIRSSLKVSSFKSFTVKNLAFASETPLYKWVYGTAHTDSFVSVDKARKVLGWEPKYDESQALIRSYQWYIDNKGSIAKGTGTTHRIAWAQGILALFKKFL